MMDLPTAQRLFHDLASARVAGDVDAVTKNFADDATFRIVGVGTEVRGKEAVRVALRELIEQFEFLEWEQLAVLVNSNGTTARHRLRVRHRPNGKIADTETCEFLTLRDGKCTSFVQFADTALVLELMRD